VCNFLTFPIYYKIGKTIEICKYLKIKKEEVVGKKADLLMAACG